jgi:hypothetical protein
MQTQAKLIHNQELNKTSNSVMFGFNFSVQDNAVKAVLTNETRSLPSVSSTPYPKMAVLSFFDSAGSFFGLLRGVINIAPPNDAFDTSLYLVNELQGFYGRIFIDVIDGSFNFFSGNQVKISGVGVDIDSDGYNVTFNDDNLNNIGEVVAGQFYGDLNASYVLNPPWVTSNNWTTRSQVKSYTTGLYLNVSSGGSIGGNVNMSVKNISFQCAQAYTHAGAKGGQICGST